MADADDVELESRCRCERFSVTAAVGSAASSLDLSDLAALSRAPLACELDPSALRGLAVTDVLPDGSVDAAVSDVLPSAVVSDVLPAAAVPEALPPAAVSDAAVLSAVVDVVDVVDSAALARFFTLVAVDVVAVDVVAVDVVPSDSAAAVVAADVSVAVVPVFAAAFAANGVAVGSAPLR